MSFLKYRNPDFVDGSLQTLVDPDEINQNFDDIARVVNGGLGGENLTPGVKLGAAEFECGRSYVPITFDFGSDYTAGTRNLFKASHAMELVSVGVVGANTTGATQWLVMNGATVMADLFIKSGDNISYIVDTIYSKAIAANETVSIAFTGTGTIYSLTLLFSAAHQR